VYLLASKAGINTGRALARKLGLKFHTNANKIKPNSDILIRYGNAQVTSMINKDTEVNSRDSIIKMSAKHRLSNMLAGDSDLLSPIYYSYRYDTRLPTNLTFPVLARKRIHRAGNDIKICYSYDDIPMDVEFLVDFYQTSREYRVHVFDGKAIKIFRKYPTNERTAHPHIRTSVFGWHYVKSDEKKILCKKSLVNTAIKVANLIGAVFCGVDIAWSDKENMGRWIVWEVNSAPSLNSASLELYTNLFKKLFYGNEEVFRGFRWTDNNNGGNLSAN